MKRCGSWLCDLIRGAAPGGRRDLEERLSAQRKATASLVDEIARRDLREAELRARLESLDRELALAQDLTEAALPGLTAAELERVAILAEESAEVVRMCGKILRHGWESCSPYDNRSRPNRVMLEREVGGLRGIVDLMTQRGDIRAADIRAWHRRKRASLAQWTHHQQFSEDGGASSISTEKRTAS